MEAASRPMRQAAGVSRWGLLLLALAVGLGAGSLEPPVEPARAATMMPPLLVDDIDQVASGSSADHTCAPTVSGAIFCWGRNDWGQLGDGTNVDRPIPVLAGEGSAAATGHDHTCALSGGIATCWGRNVQGQLGDGGDCGLSCTGVDVHPADLVAVAAGFAHSCAVDVAADVWCWGNNYHGQLGRGTVGATLVRPAKVPLSLAWAPQVAAGDWHTCAVTVDGALYCWGENTYGQLGNGLTGQNAVTQPQQVFSTAVDQVALGERQSCARLGKSVYCWGNGSGTPQEVQLGQAAVDIAVGGRHACVAFVSGSVTCWGSNETGQVGGAGTLEDIIAVTAGARHSCALTEAGGIKCWGDNNRGQLGDGGGCGTSCPLAVDVSGLDGKPTPTPTPAISVGGVAEPPDPVGMQPGPMQRPRHTGGAPAAVAWVAAVASGAIVLGGFMSYVAHRLLR